MQTTTDALLLCRSCQGRAIKKLINTDKMANENKSSEELIIGCHPAVTSEAEAVI